MAVQLLDVARELLVAETRADANEVALEALAALTGADDCVIATFEEGELVSEAGNATGFLEEFERRRLTGPTGVVRQAYRADTQCVVDDLVDIRTTATVQTQVGENRRYRSLLCVPRQELVLLAVARQPARFDEEMCETVEELGDLLAAALEGLDTAGSESEQLETAATVFSHDVSNALQIARTYLELACAEADDPEHLEKAASATDYVTELVGDMVRLLRTGTRITSPQQVDLKFVATQAWRSTDTTRGTLEVESTGPLLAHESSLRQLLENLFRNSVEHGSTSPRSHAPEDSVDHGDTEVTVRVGVCADRDGFFVEDDGEGIPPEERENVFEIGYSTAQSGTGFGLGICCEIVRAHGWELNVTEGRDGGARFEVTGVTFVDE